MATFNSTIKLINHETMTMVIFKRSFECKTAKECLNIISNVIESELEERGEDWRASVTVKYNY